MNNIFLNNTALLLLIILPLLIILLVLAQRKRRQALCLLLNKKTAKQLTDPHGSRSRHISELCLLTALALIIVALARPVWDSNPIPQPQAGRDLIFMLDVSQSMLAEDQPPNRLEYAKNSIMQCLDELKSGRVSLVAFAGSTSIKCPLTKNFEFFRSALTDLAPDSVAIGGTRIGDAINKTIEKILGDKNADNCDIIIITDGENHTPINTNALSRLVDSNANLIIIGMGSDSVPALIPVFNEERNITEPLTNNNHIVYTLQNSKHLSRISDLTPRSTYINVGTNPLNLADIYKTHTARTIPADDENKTTERPIEQYWRFLLAALICIAAAYLPRYHKTASILSQRSLVTSIIMVGLVLSAASANAKSRTAYFTDGISAYKSGDFDRAVEHFTSAEQKKPAPVITFNLGTAYYRLGNMQNAVLHFTTAAQSTDNKLLAIDALYNTGNSFFMMAIHTPGISQELAIENLQHAIAAYQSVIFNKPNHKDAIFNLEASQKMLAAMQQSSANNSDGEEGESENESDENEESDKNSASDSKEMSSDKSNQDEDEDEMSAPSLTPDDIIKEEEKNNLKRSRKKHSDFGKVKMNW